jgi:type II secretory pathway pseudopilin PulG
MSAARLKHGPQAGTDGFSVPELLLSIMVVFTLAMVVVSYAWQAQLKANEASAVVSLRVINSAEYVYFGAYGAGFSRTLAELGPSKSGSASATAADLLAEDLASGRKGGYQFTYTPVSDVPAGDAKGARKRIKIVLYSIAADPVRPGLTGVRYYYIDESGVIRFSLRNRATALSPPI